MEVPEFEALQSQPTPRPRRAEVSEFEALQSQPTPRPRRIEVPEFEALGHESLSKPRSGSLMEVPEFGALGHKSLPKTRSGGLMEAPEFGALGHGTPCGSGKPSPKEPQSKYGGAQLTRGPRAMRLRTGGLRSPQRSRTVTELNGSATATVRTATDATTSISGPPQAAHQ